MSEMETTEVVRVGIAEGALARRPQRLRTNGLGSCVGVVLYDNISGVCGLVHVMLPEAPGPEKHFPKTKFADSGIVWLVEQMINVGANRRRLAAKIAGGAQMFTVAGGSDLLRIGPRNVDAVERVLTRLEIPLIAKDVGGSEGRTIEFASETGVLSIRTAMKGTIEV